MTLFSLVEVNFFITFSLSKLNLKKFSKQSQNHCHIVLKENCFYILIRVLVTNYIFDII